MDNLTCLPDTPEMGVAVMKRMDEMDLPLIEDMFVMLNAEGATLLACPLNVPMFGMNTNDLVDGVTLADPTTYYKDVVMQADMNLTF